MRKIFEFHQKLAFEIIFNSRPSKNAILHGYSKNLDSGQWTIASLSTHRHMHRHHFRPPIRFSYEVNLVYLGRVTDCSAYRAVCSIPITAKYGQFYGNFQYSRTIKQTLKKYSSCDAMLLHADMHGCKKLKGSSKCGCLLVPHQAAVVNVIVHCPGFSNAHTALGAIAYGCGFHPQKSQRQ
jgi:hypothetical protein